MSREGVGYLKGELNGGERGKHAPPPTMYSIKCNVYIVYMWCTSVVYMWCTLVVHVVYIGCTCVHVQGRGA